MFIGIKNQTDNLHQHPQINKLILAQQKSSRLEQETSSLHSAAVSNTKRNFDFLSKLPPKLGSQQENKL